MKRLLSIFVYLHLFSTYLSAQYYYYDDKYYANDFNFEISVGAGLFNSVTDIGSNGRGRNFIRDLNWRNNRPSYSAGMAFTYKNILSSRLAMTYGEIHAADSLFISDESIARNNRNLSFKSSVTEIHLGIEFYPLAVMKENTASFLHPYIVGGIGYFHFNPLSQLDGKWYTLHRLQLEGQGFAEYPERKRYRLYQICLPAGFGIKYEYSASMLLQFEMLYRLLFTDYLDDISTSYIDPSLFVKYLSDSDAKIASRLYNRIKTPVAGNNLTGIARGNPHDRDAYLGLQLKLCWRFMQRR